MQVWETNLRFIDRAQLSQVKKTLCTRCALFSRIGSNSLVSCLVWIVSHDRIAKREVKLCANMRKSLRPLRSLPRQIEIIARKVDCIGDMPMYSPSTQFWPARSNPTASELRACAEWIRKQICDKEALLQHWKKGWSTEGTKALVFLVQTVRGKTGQPRFQQIADLLTEVSRILEVDAEYDTDAIKMRVHRKARTVS